MKLTTCLLLVFAWSASFAQIPAGYYDAAIGYTGDSLRIKLNEIIRNHTEFPYTSTGTDVWDILKETDRDTLNPNNVILLYSGWSVDAAQEFNSGSGWSREHVWAKSRGDFGTSMGPGTDVHALRPADISVNSARNNRWFAECSEPYVDGSGATGSYTSSSEWVWKPRDEVKGDVARMIFYMATRYEGDGIEPDLQVIDSIPSDNFTNLPIHAKLYDLLQWHIQDPVSDWERNRNDIIYYSYQNNRNPYIDHPEYVAEIWQSVVGTSEIETMPSLSIFPNPADEQITVEFATSDSARIKLFAADGELLLERVLSNTGSAVLDVKGFTSGSYVLVVETEFGVSSKPIALQH